MKALCTILFLAWCAIPVLEAAEPKPITVKVGEEFKLRLEAATAGYQWLLAKPLNETLLKQTGKSYERPRGSRESKAFELLSYKALAEGRTIVYLKYDRLFERTGAPLLTTNYTIVITKADAK